MNKAATIRFIVNSLKTRKKTIVNGKKYRNKQKKRLNFSMLMLPCLRKLVPGDILKNLMRIFNMQKFPKTPCSRTI